MSKIRFAYVIVRNNTIADYVHQYNVTSPPPPKKNQNTTPSAPKKKKKQLLFCKGNKWKKQIDACI